MIAALIEFPIWLYAWRRTATKASSCVVTAVVAAAAAGIAADANAGVAADAAGRAVGVAVV